MSLWLDLNTTQIMNEWIINNHICIMCEGIFWKAFIEGGRQGTWTFSVQVMMAGGWTGDY